MLREDEIIQYTTNDGKVFYGDRKAAEQHIQTRLVETFENHLRDENKALLGEWETAQAIKKIELSLFSNIETARKWIRALNFFVE